VDAAPLRSQIQAMESVWDYPRPPRVEASTRHVEVWFAGERIADTRRAQRVLETSHPPTWYLPMADCRMDLLEPEARQTLCEFKGAARYFTLRVGDRVSRHVAWTYPDPTPAFASLKDTLCFYPSRVDEAIVDGERVRSQEGDFYGGWITSDVAGPFKGGPGTLGW